MIGLCDLFINSPGLLVWGGGGGWIFVLHSYVHSFCFLVWKNNIRGRTTEAYAIIYMLLCAMLLKYLQKFYWNPMTRSFAL